MRGASAVPISARRVNNTSNPQRARGERESRNLTSPFGISTFYPRTPIRARLAPFVSTGSSNAFHTEERTMFIPIILGATRRGRQSVKVAKFIHARLAKFPDVETELLDLAEYNFPIMEERLRMRDDPPPRAQEFSEKLQR